MGVARVDLYLPGVGSLKGRRSLVNKARAALVKELDCSVAEIGETDQWQRARLGVAAAASSETGARRVVDRVVAVVERDPRVIITGSASFVDAFGPDDLDPLTDLARRLEDEPPPTA